MADPAILEQQLKQLTQATRLMTEAQDHLKTIEDKQNERWQQLRELINRAGDQYVSMQINAVEENLRDKSASVWLSCILTVGLTLIPISAVTSTFLLAMTKSMQRLLTRSTRAERESLKFLQEETARLGLKSTVTPLMLSREIKRTEEMVAKFAKNLDPELSNTLQDVARKLADTVGTQPFQQDNDRKKMTNKTDAPLVVVKNSLHGWIDVQVKAENTARRIFRDRLRDLFDIATSPKPAKEAKAKKEAAKEKEAIREPRVPLRRPVEEFPKTGKGAINELSKLRDEAVPTPDEKASTPAVENLEDLQLIIESMIWCATYDFTPTSTRKNLNWDDPKVRAHWITVKMPAPLPENLWKRLIERYIDPDEGKSYKDAVNLDRLGTKKEPFDKGKWSPEIRLSHYFSQILYPQLNNANSEIVQKFRVLGTR